MRGCILWHVLLISCLAAQVPGQDRGAAEAAKLEQPEQFKLVGTLEAAGNNVDFAVCFHGDYAVAFVSDELDALFHLRKLWWQSAGSGKRVTLEQSQAWHAENKQKSERSLATTKDNALREFVAAMMEPNFNVSDAGDGFVIKNAVMEYSIELAEKVPPERMAVISKYNQLAAYQTAMTQRKLPPDPALAVNAEFERRSVYPARMTLTITTPKAKQQLKIAMKLQPLTRKDQEAITKAMEDAQRAAPESSERSDR